MQLLFELLHITDAGGNNEPPHSNPAAATPAPWASIHCFWLYFLQNPDIRAFHLEIFACVSVNSKASSYALTA